MPHGELGILKVQVINSHKNACAGKICSVAALRACRTGTSTPSLASNFHCCCHWCMALKYSAIPPLKTQCIYICVASALNNVTEPLSLHVSSAVFFCYLSAHPQTFSAISKPAMALLDILPTLKQELQFDPHKFILN